MATLSSLANIKNLQLAWDRILSGSNYKYKKYFRDLYNTYDVAIEDNLSHLSERLLSETYRPQDPIIIYEPKPSGFIRPISFLTIEDQIVLQAIANLYASKFSNIRKSFEGISVFSNILDRTPGSVFFFEKWIDSYNSFQTQSQNLFMAGSVWIMDFDLAAFYDTISHDLLIRKLIPKKENSLKEFIVDCLRVWTAPNKSLQRGHGIPQGPVASDFLAEIILHSIDEELKREHIVYLRYVDDFRFFGFNKHQVLNYLHETDKLCKKHGLIPQNSKISIRKIKKIDDFKTFEASRDPDDDEDDEISVLDKEEAESLFFSSVDSNTGDFKVRSTIKFVLRRSGPSYKIKHFVLSNLTRNLQFTEDIFTYFENYIDDAQVFGKVKGLLWNRFDFVRAHAWFYLAKSINSFNPTSLTTFVKYAIAEVKSNSDNTLARLGALLFLTKVENRGRGSYSNFIVSEPTWFNKATLANELPTRLLTRNKTIKTFFGKRHFEPSLMLGPQLHQLGIKHTNLGIKTSDLKSQTKNLYRKLEIIRTSKPNTIDPISEILHSRYGIIHWNNWKQLLSTEYKHALGILIQGDRLYYKSKDKWLENQDSFNNCLFFQIIATLKTLNLPGQNTNIHNRNGGLNSFGNLTSPGNLNDFIRSYPTIAQNFYETHKRRNNLPGTHPYDLKSFARSRPLLESERTAITQKYKNLYSEIIGVFDPHM